MAEEKLSIWEKVLRAFTIKPLLRMPENEKERRRKLKNRLIMSHAEGNTSLSIGRYIDRR